MIKVALYGENSYLEPAKRFIENIYNMAVVPLGGEPLMIMAVIGDEKKAAVNRKDYNFISVKEYIKLYKAGAMDALILPVDCFVAQNYVLTDILKEECSLDDVYVLKRLSSIKAETYEEIADTIMPYTSSKYLPYLEYHVADGCNMNCSACEHYSGLAPKDSFPEFDKFEEQFRKFNTLIDDIGMLRILGGEPLMNPELPKYLYLSRELYPYSSIHIVTNGILVTQMSDELIKAIKENKVRVNISFYPPLVDKMPEIRNFLESKGISHFVYPVTTKFTKKQTLKAADNKDYFYKCYQAHCNNFYDGKVGACFLPFTTKYFNKEYNTELPEDGGISVMDEEMTSEKLSAGLLQPFERCRYCTEPVEMEWSRVEDKSDMSNWLVECEREEKTEEPLITIYTQCYNGDKYIEKCIRSVLNQTYTNFEYYVCNHGSTDNTQEIIDKYAAIDGRIKPLYFDNKERGFYPDYMKEHANGEYFAMLDSDDWWSANHLETLLKFTQRYQLDMCVCGIDAYIENENRYEVLRCVDKPVLLNIGEINRYWRYIYDFFKTTWGKLIRMDVLRKADFTVYYENAKTFISDDTAFTLANLAQCKRIGAIPEILLTYRISSTSVTANYKPSLIENNLNIYRQSIDLLDQIGDTDDASKEYMLRVLLSSLNYSMDMLFAGKMSDEEKSKELDRILSTEFVKKIISYDTNREFRFVKLIDEWKRIHS